MNGGTAYGYPDGLRFSRSVWGPILRCADTYGILTTRDPFAKLILSEGAETTA